MCPFNYLEVHEQGLLVRQVPVVAEVVMRFGVAAAALQHPPLIPVYTFTETA